MRGMPNIALSAKADGRLRPASDLLDYLLPNLGNPALSDKFSNTIDLCICPILLPFCAVVARLGFLGNILEIFSKTKNVENTGRAIEIDLRGKSILFRNRG